MKRQRASIAGAFLFAFVFAARALPALELVEVVSKMEKSVVRIEAGDALGSGVIVDDAGLVITNVHVIRGAKQVTVMLKSGKVMTCRGFLVADPLYDLAVLKTDKFEEPSSVKLAAALPKIGEKVAAFGNPQGFSFTTSEGIIAAIRRGKEVEGTIGRGGYARLGYAADATWIQTTAAISGGNSGGPLVNMNAELLGLNTWSAVTGQNLNFAIALPDIDRVLKQAASVRKPHPFDKLPSRKNTPSSPDERPDAPSETEDLQLTLPNGRVFSFDIFNVRNTQFSQVAGTTRGDVVSMNHPSGAVFAVAAQKNGLLHGVTLAQWENKHPMVYASYLDGKRHGLILTWNEAGKPTLFGQYAQGKRDGFTCFFDNGQFCLLTLYKMDKLQWAQAISDEGPGEGFSSREAAESDDDTRELLTRQDAFEATLKINEVRFRKFVKEFDAARKRALASQASSIKRKEASERERKRAAADNAVHDSLYRNFLGS